MLDEFNGRERATVFFVDYGAVEQVSVKDIRLKNMFFKIPVQTFRCHLEGIEPASERNTKSRNYTESALNLLHELTVNNEFNITVENFSPLRVSLKFLDNDVKVSSLLVAARKAKYRERGQAPTPTDLKAQ